MSALENLSALITGAARLTEEHLKLARLELKADAREIGTRIGVIVALLPLVLVGYGFLCVGRALYLARTMGMEAAFTLVGGVNLLGALAGFLVAAQKLKSQLVLGATVAEIEATTVAVRGGSRPEGGE
jgi:hypothetical protein